MQDAQVADLILTFCVRRTPIPENVHLACGHARGLSHYENFQFQDLRPSAEMACSMHGRCVRSRYDKAGHLDNTGSRLTSSIGDIDVSM